MEKLAITGKSEHEIVSPGTTQLSAQLEAPLSKESETISVVWLIE